MARSSAPIRSCPACLAPLIEIRLGQELTLRSCSGCDTRFWTKQDEETDLHDVLAVVSTTDSRGRPPAAAS
jgi:hypothetical protein